MNEIFHNYYVNNTFSSNIPIVIVSLYIGKVNGIPNNLFLFYFFTRTLFGLYNESALLDSTIFQRLMDGWSKT